MKIITLCGSTRFKIEFELMIKLLIDNGWFVRSVEVYDVPRVLQLPKGYKDYLEGIHFDKILKSNAILVIDVGGYIGESTQNEIIYAEVLHIKTYYYSALIEVGLYNAVRELD